MLHWSESVQLDFAVFIICVDSECTRHFTNINKFTTMEFWHGECVLSENIK